MKILQASVITLMVAALAIPSMAQGGGGGGGMGGMGGMGGGGGGTRVNSSGGQSAHETTGRVVSGNRVTITYGRPSAKGRKIWGELVPWDKAWRLGSDEATTIIPQQSIAFGDVVLQGGTAYTLYMVPSESGASKLAISKKIGAWGIPVDVSQDLGRVDLKKDSTAAPVEQLTIAVANESGGGVIRISWENTMYSASFTNKK